MNSVEFIITSDNKLKTKSPCDEEANSNTQNNGEFFIQNILKTWILSKWKNQANVLKYTKGTRYNAKRKAFKTFIRKVIDAFEFHKLNYLYDLYENMEKLPYKKGVVHDKNYGKISIVNNATLKIKYQKRIRFLAKLYFIIRINSELEDILLASINKMKEDKIKNRR